jgi:anti-sigma factor RsiW
MERLDRSVAGVTCREVLADLSSYIDGELGTARAAQLRAHVAGCRECDRFGGFVAALVDGLRRELSAAHALDAGTARRLAERLNAERSGAARAGD